MDWDVVFLSRLQFALTIMFHYLFPPLTIGMGVVMVYLEGMYLYSKEPIYETAARFWTQLFAVTFAVGVATGIVMEFQFGTNWAVYSRFVGDVFGAALAAEGIFAFFLESGFLAILVFGWDKVSPRFHFFATLMVSMGSMFSAVWIIIANSWQQTPTGHHIVQMLHPNPQTGVMEPWFINGVPIMRAQVLDFWGVVFNPSTVDRLTHTLIGAFIMGAFFIMSISAWYLLKGRHIEFSRRSFSGALIFATVFSVLQAFSGHSNAEMIAKEQPAKLAAFEGHFKTGPADMTIVGLPDQAAEKMSMHLAVPRLLSAIVHWDWNASVIGLDAFPKADWPPVLLSFLCYHLMVGIGVFFIAITMLACFFRWRKTLFTQRWLLWMFVASVLLAVAANQLGWVAAEVGRQPWIVQVEMERDASGWVKLDDQGKAVYRSTVVANPNGGEPFSVLHGLRTSAAVSEAVRAEQVAGSIVMFGFIYILLGALWVFVLNHKIQRGPVPVLLGIKTTGEGVREALAGRIEHEQSLSEAKTPPGKES